jgi:hypothetical protein
MYGPSLPATGGGLTVAALIWGVNTNNLLVIVFAVLGLIAVGYSFLRLRHGEKNM